MVAPSAVTAAANRHTTQSAPSKQTVWGIESKDKKLQMFDKPLAAAVKVAGLRLSEGQATCVAHKMRMKR